jgi:hypothetical protein
MRHQSQHVALLVQDSGDGARRAVGVGRVVDRAVLAAIAESDQAFAFEPVERVLVGEIIAVVMRHRHADHLAGVVAPRVDALAGLDAQMHVLAVEAQRLVGEQHARQQAGFGDDLEAVADAEHRRARLGARLDFAHDRRMRCHRAAAQVIAIGKAARNDDQVGLGQVAVAMPDFERLSPRGAPQRVVHVLLAV